MAQTEYGNISCSNKKYNNRVVDIVKLLDQGLSEKEINKRTKVPFGTIRNIQKKYNVLKHSATVMKNKEENNVEKDNEKELLKNEEVKTEVVMPVDDIIEKEKIKPISNTSKYKGTEITGKREKLSDDVILKIIEMCEEGISKTQIAEELGIAYSTTCRYAKEFGMTTNKRKSRSQTSKKKNQSKNTRIHGGKGKSFNTINENNSEIVPGEKYASTVLEEKIKESVDTGNCDNLKEIVEFIKNKESSYKEDVVTCGLIKDRHDMPVNKFIFNTIGESIMFKYDELDKIVADFIKTEVKLKKDDNGELIGAKSLVVYVTGLTCCVSSLIKVCHSFGVNLTLMHFNNRNGSYIKQVIWNSFGKGYINKLFPNATEIELHNISVEEMKENRFYVMRTVKLHESLDNEVIYDIFKEQDQVELWMYHGKMLSETMIDKTRKNAVYVDLSEIKDEKVYSINKVSAVYNWSKVDNQ